jgi:hypothetical protein
LTNKYIDTPFGAVVPANGDVTILRKTGSLTIFVLLLSAIFIATTTGTAHAYIDAGTGSLVLQFLLAGLFGFLFALKVFWSRVAGTVSMVLSKLGIRKSP